MKPVAVTMGDAAGIGPEVLVKALLSSEIQGMCRAAVLGDVEIIRKYCDDVNRSCSGIVSAGVKVIKDPEEAVSGDNVIYVLEPGKYELSGLVPGKAQKACGKAAVECVRAAVNLVQEGRVGAIVTAPWCKEAVHLAGFDYPGHTEFIAELAGVKDVAMMIAGGSLKAVLATTHLPIKDVPKNLTAEGIYKMIHISGEYLLKTGVYQPRIGVTALNPHAGENGLLGSEERDIILPAIERAKKDGIDVTGPVPADKAMYDVAGSRYDIVVAMYHDQVLIPVKILAFNRGVNVTLGLPFTRTSPCHGTAFDIAGKNTADPRSMVEAIKFAVKNENTLGTKLSC